MNGPLIIQASVLHDFYVQVFLRTGVPEADAHLAAAVRLESALRLPVGLDAFTVSGCRIRCVAYRPVASIPPRASRSCTSVPPLRCSMAITAWERWWGHVQWTIA